MHRKVITNIAFIVVMFLACTISSFAQQKNKLNVALRINEEVEQFSGQMIASGTNAKEAIYTSLAAGGLGQAPGGVVLRIQRVEQPANAYQVWVDSDGDGNLSNETPQLSAPNSSIIARVNRKWSNGRQQLLPYSIKYSREPDQKGVMRERFNWLPHYRAEGRLKTKTCETLLVVLDLNSDGQFDSEDFSRGTSIGLDRDGNKRIWGKDEYLKGEQIIEYCGESFLVDGLAVDGTSVSLVNTELRVPKVGEQLPALMMKTIDGDTIDSTSLRRKVHLLDFWASWCKPCVEKFSLVKQLAQEFKDEVIIIAVNVDEEPLLPAARQIIKTYRLPWPHVMNGRGEADPLWKMFGTMSGNRLSIPLYVVVDSEGRLSYAGNGGEDLSELRLEIKGLLEKKE